MFTFSKGFEAASLKIPQKEPQSSTNGPYSHDQQGHVPNPQWSHDENFGSQSSNNAPPQRKQIIGFAKFKTRGEALEARDMLQGKKVDPERGSTLKAEMAKKNLHTKRGPGPSGLPLSMVAPGNMVGVETLATLAGLPGGVAGLPTQSSGEAMRDRERELGALGAMGFIGSGGLRRERDSIVVERRREQVPESSSRSRFVGSESDVEAETNRFLRSQNEVAFDAFHAVPVQPYRTSASTTRSVLSPSDSFTSLSPGQELPQYPPSLSASMTSGSIPWTFNGQQANSSTNGSSPQSDISNFPTSLSGFSLTDSPPMVRQNMVSRYDPNKTVINEGLREHRVQLGKLVPQAHSSASSVTGSRSSIDEEAESSVNGALTQQGSSPPYSTSSFVSSKMNPSDQNPPINTLYVGNLPNTAPATGFGPNLEESLRLLFSQCPGYRKLVYKYKNGNPMCFVEVKRVHTVSGATLIYNQFDDVSHATNALNDLYGNQVNGLVKSGIRLSYSKNPLGVRASNLQSCSTTVRQNSNWLGDLNTIVSPTGTNPHPLESTMLHQSIGSRPQEFHDQMAQRTMHPSVVSPTYAPNPYHYFSSDTLSDQQPNANSMSGVASTFSPFYNLDLSTLSLNRESIPPLTPSPGIEAARAC